MGDHVWTLKQWMMKGARALFLIQVSAGDDMVYQIVDVKTLKEA